MGWKDTIEPIIAYLPGVEGPTGHVSLKKKAIWTIATLSVYFFLTNILVFGMAQGGQGTDVFGQFRSILAGAQGSILTLGIGPIVTGSIVVQLLDGGGLLDIDQNNPRDQAIYQGLQKLLVIAVTALTAIPMAFSGFMPPSEALGAALGIGTVGVSALIFVQLFIGGLIILFLDEVVSKWGIGSGVGLFIIAGVSQRLIGGIFSQLIPGWFSIATNGLQAPLLSQSGLSALLIGQGNIIPILTTIIIFTTVVYAESTRIEIPLSHANTKGGRARFPIKLIYASVLPMIFVRAIQANIQMIGRILESQMGEALPAWVGVYSGQGQPVSGLFYYLSPIYRPEDWMWWLGQTTAEIWQILIRLGVDLTFMVSGGAIFAVFWVETANMGPESVADQILNMGMQIPGFRKNPKIIERVVSRYIPAISMLGGAIVGVLAVSANMLGTIGAVSGTGLLLSVSITIRMYQEVAEEEMMAQSKILRKMFG